MPRTGARLPLDTRQEFWTAEEPLTGKEILALQGSRHLRERCLPPNAIVRWIRQQKSTCNLDDERPARLHSLLGPS